MYTNFHTIDMEKWPGAQMYHYFTEIVTTTTYSVTVRLDITALWHSMQEKHLRFFPLYLYLVTHSLSQQPEFCLALRNGVLGYWEVLHPYYPVFHTDSKSITFISTRYDPACKVFYQNCRTDMENARAKGQAQYAKAAADNYIISCIPWFSFDSLSMHLQNAQNYYAPIFESGKPITSGNKIFLPLSITVNHATLAGYHISRLLDELQTFLHHPESWLS